MREDQAAAHWRRGRGAVVLAACALAACAPRVAAPGRKLPPGPHAGHLEIWIAEPAAGPYVLPLFWLNSPQLALGEAARQLGLAGGRSGQGHGLVHLVSYQPPDSLWVEQYGVAGGITGRPANQYPTIEKLQSRKRYGARRIFTVLLVGLDETQLRALNAFLRQLGEDYDGYGFGHPNCADLCADAWSRADGPPLPRGAFWLPLDLAAHVVNLPGRLFPWLSVLRPLSPVPWRNRTPDQVRRQLVRLGVAHLQRRAIGDVTEREVANALGGRGHDDPGQGSKGR